MDPIAQNPVRPENRVMRGQEGILWVVVTRFFLLFWGATAGPRLLQQLAGSRTRLLVEAMRIALGRSPDTIVRSLSPCSVRFVSANMCADVSAWEPVSGASAHAAH